VPPLLAVLSPSTLPSKLVAESLRAVNTVAESIWSDIRATESQMAVSLANQLYSKPTVDYLAEILSQQTNSLDVDHQFVLTLQIIDHTLWLPHHQSAVVKAGILDILGAKMAAHFTSTLGEPNPFLPPPPPPGSLADLLNAVTAIIQNSLYHSVRLLYTKEFFRLFAPADRTRPFIDTLNTPTTAFDVLLPKLQAVQARSDHSSSKVFPPLAALAQPSDFSRLPDFNSHTAISSRTINADDFGSPILAWLVYLARSTEPLERLAAVWLLTHLIHASDRSLFDAWQDTSRNRDRTLAMLIAPLVVKMVDEAQPKPGKDIRPQDVEAMQKMQEKAPEALALLLEDRMGLQRVAVDAKAPKLLGQILKKSFDPITDSHKPLWSPHPNSSSYIDPSAEPASSILGPPTLSANAVHRYKVRSAALRALAAIGQKDDTNRKLIIENGVVQCIVDSLAPWPDGPVTSSTSDVQGNPPFVVVSACKVATALSRSVSVLRTSLIDGGIAKPIFALLKHPDLQVQLAATDVVTNLILQFSPMREVGTTRPDEKLYQSPC
jgi:armadillo repeat-containing protein 8